EEEKAKALQQAKGLYQQANQSKSQPKLEDTFWKQKGSVDKIEYYFRNGSLIDNELLYFENEQLDKGLWNFKEGKDEITMNLKNKTMEFIIIDIQNALLKLKDKTTNEILIFEKI